MTILTQKALKSELSISKCLQGTTVENVGAYGERINHKYGTRGKKATLRVPRVRKEAAKILLVPRPILFQRTTSWHPKLRVHCSL